LVRADAGAVRRRAGVRAAVGILELLGAGQVDVSPAVPRCVGRYPLLRDARAGVARVSAVRGGMLGDVADDSPAAARARGRTAGRAVGDVRPFWVFGQLLLKVR